MWMSDSFRKLFLLSAMIPVMTGFVSGLTPHISGTENRKVVELGDLISDDPKDYVHIWSELPLPEKVIENLYKNADIDLSKVDAEIPGIYQIEISWYGHIITENVRIQDTTAPEGILKEKIIRHPAGKPLYARDLVTDLFDRSDTVFVIFENGEQEMIFNDMSVSEIQLILYDPSGNQTFLTQNLDLYIPDRTPPELTVPKDRVIEIGMDFNPDDGLLAVDDVDGDLTEKVLIETDLDTKTPGTYEIRYRVSDSAGNETTKTITVTVEEETEESSVTGTDDGVFRAESNVPASRVSLASELYAAIPASVRSFMKAHGTTVLITMDGAATGGHAGMCHPLEDTNWTNTACIYAASDGKVNLAVQHEIGHSFDNLLAHVFGGKPGYYKGTYYSNNDDFVAIFQADVGSAGYPSYNSTDPVEFFAETFRQYCISPSEARRRAPQATAFIERCLSMI